MTKEPAVLLEIGGNQRQRLASGDPDTKWEIQGMDGKPLKSASIFFQESPQNPVYKGSKVTLSARPETGKETRFKVVATRPDGKVETYHYVTRPEGGE